MKKYYQLLLILSIIFLANQSFASNGNFVAGCSVAGTPSLTNDSICYGDTTRLILTGYTGAIQWQSFDGTNWNNETGAGSTSDQYDVSEIATKEYRAIVTASGCSPDTSVKITLTVGTLHMPSGPTVTRCGPGQVTFTGIGQNLLQWYTTSSGGAPIGSGSPFSAYVPVTATYYLENSSFGGGSGGKSPILVSEADLDDNGGSDDFEIINAAPFDVDITGWQVAVGDGYTDISLVNTVVNTLSGTLTPGQTITWNDGGSGNYWGSNLLWTGGSQTVGGWIAIIDNNNVLRDVAIWGYDSAAIQNASWTINGNIYSPSTVWIGDPIDNSAGSGTSLNRIGNFDHDNNTDWTSQALTIGAPNTNMTIPFLGLGCSSPRYPIQVTINAADDVTGSTSSSSVCLNETINLSATSTNSNYIYTWSPDSNLSSTTGASITATPQSSVSYIVVGDDGICSNRDTIDITVLQHTPGTPASVTDTVCSGNPTDLSLSGYIGTIQWQVNDGSGWVNASGAGSTSDLFTVNPLVSSQYRAIVSSGFCPDDTSSSLSIAALTATDPIMNDTTVCAPSFATLYASSLGNVAWFTDSTSASEVFLGNIFTPYITSDTSFYLSTKVGAIYRFGPQTNAIGSITQIPAAGYGLQFDVVRPCTIDKIYVYPAQTGNLVLNLRAVQNGPVLATKTIAITSAVGKQAIDLNWAVNPGTDYRIELGTASISLKYNFTGAAYPYTQAGSPVTINGFINPNFSTTNQYFFFYDWHILEGCESGRTQVNISTISGPPIPVIDQNDSILVSSVATGNQWYLNGSPISGAINQTYTMTQTGLYVLEVSTPNGCYNYDTLNVIALALDEFSAAGISVYPNPVGDLLNIKLENAGKNVSLRIYSIAGAAIYEKQYKGSDTILKIETDKLISGTYLLEMNINDRSYRKVIIKN